MQEITVEELRDLCVNRFPRSITRERIMNGLEEIIKRLKAKEISVDIWVNGSFVTEKINPEDSDIVLCVQGLLYEQWSDDQRDIVDWIASDNLKSAYKCDSYAFHEYPDAHPFRESGESLRKFWMDWFGHDKNKNEKGFAIIKL